MFAPTLGLVVLGSMFLSGCASRVVIPDDLALAMDRSVSFASLQLDPEAHRGEMIALGGVILKARNLKEGTQIELLQLPLDRYDRPVGRLTDSQGRYLVMHPGYLETAVFQKGQRVTIVGEVAGQKLRMIDELEYAYPVLKATFIHVWPGRRQSGRFDPYYAYPYAPWYYPWRPYWYDPWGPPLIVFPDHHPKKDKRRFNPGRSSPEPSSKGSKRSF